MSSIFNLAALLLILTGPVAAQAPENVYRGQLIAFPGPWQFQIPRSGIIIVRDEELETLAADPDKVINLATGLTPENLSLRQICERAQAHGERTLILAFDHFFKQYRPGQDTPRRLMPDTDEYIAQVAAISRFAWKYGLGLELSVLTPLELGKGYTAATGEAGLWMHYREGLRDPRSGAFSVELWQQQQWVNNKGVFAIEDAGVRAFAFRETRVPGTYYRAVDPADIVEIKDGLAAERLENVTVHAGDFRAVRIRVHGAGALTRTDLDHVLVVQLYRTPEMDYFSPRALPFLTHLIDKYAAAGIHLNALYSDEMHIQQDWGYFGHHDHGEFALRYVSPGLARAFAARYGAEYADFAKYLVYFVHGQEDFAIDLAAKQDVMHTFGSTPEAIAQTALFRARYYHLLQDGVVDLFAQAKRYAENKMGQQLPARAHATWAESPTIDYWRNNEAGHGRAQYEYTSNFVWSNTVQQAAAACDDYFKWGDFLTGNGNDHAEGGWMDRDYFALALAASTGILNDVPYSYAAHWGLPPEISKRRTALEETYGVEGSPLYAAVEDMQHRDTDVLMLYPLDLVAADERFGSWMTQYGYANYVTAAKLLERGKVDGSAIDLAGRRFTTLVTLFEPFPSTKLLAFMREFVAGGGRLVWSGPPPLVTYEGQSAREAWEDLFGVDYAPRAGDGWAVPGRRVEFAGALSAVAPQVVLTDFLVDRIYPVEPRPGTDVLARVQQRIVGAKRGNAVFLGFRPRDDQSRSLGYDVATWFEVLDALGAYAPTGKFASVNDNPDHLSRTGTVLACRFPNGAVAVAPHLRETEEGGAGGFARSDSEDREYEKRNPPPSEALQLEAFRADGHTLTFAGEHAVAFRVDDRGNLIAFAGRKCHEVNVDGRKTVFADADVDEIAWAPVAPARRVPGGAVIQIQVSGNGTVRIPAASLPGNLALFAEGPRPGSRGERVPCHREGDGLIFQATPELRGRWLYGVPQ
jgi:hypothetical protein